MLSAETVIKRSLGRAGSLGSALPRSTADRLDAAAVGGEQKTGLVSGLTVGSAWSRLCRLRPRHGNH